MQIVTISLTKIQEQIILIFLTKSCFQNHSNFKQIFYSNVLRLKSQEKQPYFVLIYIYIPTNME